LRRGLPVGLVWGEADGEVRFHPDEAVRTTIARIFSRFAETGSARRVWLWFRSEGLRIPLRMHQGWEILWVDASYHAIHQVLSNPAYAGAYAYGRTRRETKLDGSGVPQKRMRHLPQSEWQVLIKEHHEGYIDWRTFEANRVRLAGNTRPGPHKAGGAVREGSARGEVVPRPPPDGPGLQAALPNLQQPRAAIRRVNDRSGTSPQLAAWSALEGADDL
jgi:hypothetical protein